MGCIEALDVLSQALWTPDLLALSFLLATTVIKSVIPSWLPTLSTSISAILTN